MVIIIDEKLKRKYAKAHDALASLEKALQTLTSADDFARAAGQDPELFYEAFRDSVIQRFEYTFDTTWKYWAAYMLAEGKKLAVTTPKAVFRQALDASLLSEDEVRLALQMVDDRNLTMHGYDEQLIEQIIKRIPAYYNLLVKMIQKAALA